MKTLINTKTVVKDGKVTITGDIVEHEFHFPLQQVTVGYLNPGNIKFPRHIQLSSEAVFVKAYNVGFAIRAEDLIDIAAKVEPRTSFAPLFKKIPTPEVLSVDLVSELHPDFQWQESDDCKEWLDILGENSRELDKTKTKMPFVRCVASSECGRTATMPVKI